MSPIQYRYRSDYEKVVKYTEQLHSLMQSGAFWQKNYLERRKLVRRVNRLYRRLAGVFRLSHTRTVLLAAGVMALAGCPEAGVGGGSENAAPVVTITESDQIVANGETAIFTAVATDEDGDNLTFTWFVDEVEEQAESENDTLEVSRTPEAETSYQVRVDVSDGTDVVSATATLTVGAPGLSVTLENQDLVSPEPNIVAGTSAGTSVTIGATVTYAGPGTVTYAWSFDGEELPGETGESVEVTIFNSYPNVHEVTVEVTDGTLTATRTFEITARIDPVFPMSQIADIGLYSGYSSYVEGPTYISSNDAVLTGMVLGDLDNDGDTDALITSLHDFYGEGTPPYLRAEYTEIRWLENTVDDATPTFSTAGSPPDFDLYDTAGGDYRVNKPLDLADFDGDGDADLLAGTISRNYNESESKTYLTFSFSLFTNGTNEGDSTGPSFPAFATEEAPGRLGLPYLEYEYSGDLSDLSSLPGYGADWVPSAELVDIDSDGDLDLLFAYFDHTLIYGEGEGVRVVAVAEYRDGAFQTPDSIINDGAPVSAAEFSFVSAADFDLDGDVDILLGAGATGRYYSEYAYFQFFENTGGAAGMELVEPDAYAGAGYFALGLNYVNNAGHRPFDIEVVDLDGDGDLDVFAGWANTYTGDGDAPVFFENDSVDPAIVD